MPEAASSGSDPSTAISSGAYGGPPQETHAGATTVEYTVLVVLVAVVVIVTTAVMWNHTRPTCAPERELGIAATETSPC